MTRLAICPGSFDPLTLGHVAIITRALALFDRVLVAVSVNIRKQPLFTMEERAAMIRASFPANDRLEVAELGGLLAEWATPWDKRVAWEAWVAWTRVLLKAARERSWPTDAMGMISLGEVRPGEPPPKAMELKRLGALTAIALEILLLRNKLRSL